MPHPSRPCPRPALAGLLLATLSAVAACGGGGGGAAAPVAGCVMAPAAPTALAVTSVTDQSAVLSWSATAPAHCTLTFAVAVDGAASVTNLTQAHTKITGLSPGAAHRFTVEAQDLAGHSAMSDPLDVTTSTGGTIAHGVTVTGKLIWHSYPQYGFAGVHSWMANFDTGEVLEITPARLTGAMNYHFSPDGTVVVVMANDQTASQASGIQAWDLWVASVTATGLSNLTRITHGQADGSRNEDPKFSSDGTKIIFKRNLTSIVSIDVASIAVNGVDQTPAQTVLLAAPSEVGMPYFLVGSNADFLYADATTSSIKLSAGGVQSTLYAPSTHAYYPIAIDATHFYFAAGPSNDFVYRGDTSATPATRAAFIDAGNASYEFADPAPMGADWLAFVSTLPGGAGQYDVWFGEFTGGRSFRLDDWIGGASHADADLGPTFHGSVSP